MSTWRNYQPQDSSVEYDVVVIGSGLSGMTCASLLGRYGKKVAVLEAHEVAGGSIHSFKQGSEWINAGWHYVGKLAPEVEVVWNDVTDNLPIHLDEDSPTDTLHGVGSISKKNFEEVMGIPAKAYRKILYCGLAYFLVKIIPGFFAYAVWLLFTLTGFKHMACQNYSEWCRKNVARKPYTAKEDNPMWWVHEGDHGMPRDKTTAFAGAVVAEHFSHGVIHPEGGILNVVKRMCRVINQRGGCVLVKAVVKEIVVKDGSVQGVLMEDGSFIKTKAVVVAGAYFITQLLKTPPPEIEWAVKKCGPSNHYGFVFLTYEGKSSADLKIPPGCFWCKENVPANSMMRGVFMSARDSASGCAVYVLFDMTPIERGAGYETAKEEASTKALDKITNLFPELKQYSTIDAATPATSEHFLRAWAGGAYGLAWIPDRFSDYKMVRALRPQTSITGLFLTGQDVIGPGVSGGFMNGMMTAQVILHPGWRSLFKLVLVRLMIEARAKKKQKKTTDTAAKDK